MLHTYNAGQLCKVKKKSNLRRKDMHLPVSVRLLKSARNVAFDLSTFNGHHAVTKDKLLEAADRLGIRADLLGDRASVRAFSPPLNNNVRVDDVDVTTRGQQHGATSMRTELECCSMPEPGAASSKNLTFLTLNDVKMDVRTLNQFPNLTRLTLNGCDAVKGTGCFKLPNLRELNVNKTFKTIDNALDYDCLPKLESLKLHGIMDLPVWKIVRSRSLKTLHITGCSIHSIANLSLTNVSSIHINCATLEELSFLNLPVLSDLVVSSPQSHLSVHDIYAPKLQDLVMHSWNLENIYNVETPLLKVVDLCLACEFGKLSETRDPSFLKGVQSMKTRGGSRLLQYAKNLRHLEMFDAPHATELSYGLSNLKTLVVHASIENFNFSPFRPCRHLLVLKLTQFMNFTNDKVKDIEMMFPYLNTLSIRGPDVNEFAGHKFTELVTLNLESTTENKMVVRSNNLPNLVSFSAQASGLVKEESFIDLNGSIHLKEFLLYRLRTTHVRVSKFNKLDRLSLVCGGVKTIDMSNCTDVTTMDLSFNHLLNDIRCPAFERLTKLTAKGCKHIQRIWLRTPLLRRHVDHTEDGNIVFFSRREQSKL